MDVSSPDDVLLCHVVERDEAAFGLLYDRYKRLVYAIALRFTQDQETAEEVVQDVFHAVWRDAHCFQAESRVQAWVTAIARNRAIDATRRRGFRVQQHATIPIDEYVGIAGHAEHVVNQLSVRAALTDLPAEQRTVLELAYYQDCTCAQIATRLCEPLGTIKTRLRLGHAKLRKVFGDAVG